jgi:hypothetical protein
MVLLKRQEQPESARLTAVGDCRSVVGAMIEHNACFCAPFEQLAIGFSVAIYMVKCQDN